jgi:hypothetical protein
MLVRFLLVILLARGFSMIRHFGYGQSNGISLPKELLIKADAVSYIDPKQIDLLGKQFVGSTFSLTAKVRVQTSDSINPGGQDLSTYEIIPAKFEIDMVDDNIGAIHDELVSRIYISWSSRDSDRGGGYYFHSKNKQYVLVLISGLVNKDGCIIFWVNGHAFKLTFIEFINKGGWGVMDSFIETNFRVRLSNSDVKLYSYFFPDSQNTFKEMRKDFLELYESGFFQHERTGEDTQSRFPGSNLMRANK